MKESQRNDDKSNMLKPKAKGSWKEKAGIGTEGRGAERRRDRRQMMQS